MIYSADSAWTMGHPKHRPVLRVSRRSYYWQVRAFNSFQSSSWSAPNTLVINSLPNAVPARNLFTTSTPTLTWNPVTQAVRYEVQVSNNSFFTGAGLNKVGNTLSIIWPV